MKINWKRWSSIRIPMFSRLVMRPIVVGTIYILLIPIFASVYAYCWEDFYQSTASLERATKEINEGSKNVLREMLGPWLSSYSAQGFSLVSFDISDALVKDGKVTVFSSITFSYRRTPGELKLFEEVSYLRSRDDVEFDWSNGILNPKVTLKPIWLIFLKDGKFQMGPVPDFFNLKLTDYPQAFSGVQIHVRSEGENHYSAERVMTGRISLPERAKSLLHRLELASAGFPGPGGGGFPRYIYFSTVVITTLGLGDIVPMTDRARLLVALEAILGIVLAGLFLNSIAVKISGQG
ncbi:MAG: potassium channel family protein [Thermoanaerobaculia bacterium]